MHKYLFIDQHGNRVYASGPTSLHRLVGGKRPAKMYVDQPNGQALHIGYIVAGRWFTQYQRVERPA